MVPAADVKVIAALGLTVMVIPFDVAGLPVAQVADEVITTVTISLLARVVELKVALFVPAFTPLTFH